jgi:uncharacterized repeat protein (TIGR03987 family)
MFFATLNIVAALVFYSVAILAEQIQKKLHTWTIVVFATGVLFDVIGTGIMAQHTRQFTPNFHTINGFAALLIMLVHLVWALRAKTKGGTSAKLFHRFSVYAWIVWLGAFFSGIL